MFIEDYNILKPLISEFVWEKHKQYKDFSRTEMGGVFCSASSVIRKDNTLKRVRFFIKKHDLNLEISDNGLEHTAYFSIREKGKL